MTIPSWSPSDLVQLKNLRLVKKCPTLVTDDLFIRNGRICDAEKIFFTEKRHPDLILDCQGLVASPGLIDLQINGAYGRDFTAEYHAIDEALEYVSDRLLRHGVTAYCPTLITATVTVYKEALEAFKRGMEKNNEGLRRARVLGAHLEGPFIRYDKNWPLKKNKRINKYFFGNYKIN